jgi:hypothetical protein
VLSISLITRVLAMLRSLEQAVFGPQLERPAKPQLLLVGCVKSFNGFLTSPVWRESSNNSLRFENKRRRLFAEQPCLLAQNT